MNLFITGISGLLGANLALEASGRFEVAGCYRRHPIAHPGVAAMPLDVLDTGGLERTVRRLRPDVVIHTVGMSSVDACEVDPELAWRLNVETTRGVARVTRAAGVRLLHISTDHLFDGEQAWRTESDVPIPLNTYAKTKAEAERVVLDEHPDALVIRTNFYGWGTSLRASFSDWILAALNDGRALTMFTDVYFTPLLINDLADAIFGLAARGVTGLLHVAGEERLSKCDFAGRLAEVFGYSAAAIQPTTVARAGLQAPRPRDMSLKSGKAERVLGRSLPGAGAGLDRLRKLGEAGWSRSLQQAVDAGRAGGATS